MPKVAMSRKMLLKGKASVRGSIRPPGDKSISHRVAMLASIAEGTSSIEGFAASHDCWSTVDCLRRLGIKAEKDGDKLLIHGHGLGGYRPANNPVTLDAGNSGSTIRMISGLLAAQPFTSVIDGDASLRQRPMARIIDPLTQMGARIEARADNFAPLKITGGRLSPITYSSRNASAQVKTCVLFAGLYADGQTLIKEPAQSRNHSELMLKEFGARIEPVADDSANVWKIKGGAELKPLEYTVPGDVSSAAFFVAAATILPDSEILIRNVNLNPTRSAFLDVFEKLGAKIYKESATVRHGEPVGDIRVTASELNTGGESLILSGEIIANLIDEVPILAVVGSQVRGQIIIRGAKELRVKESDRIRTVVDGIRALGGVIEEFEDGFSISGPQQLKGGVVETAGDHRISMAFSVAALAAEGETCILDADCAAVSFPAFFETLSAITPEGSVIDQGEE
jgi:3-phosphoshikimate 1-carboxyvinyltransferase